MKITEPVTGAEFLGPENGTDESRPREIQESER
jgi:hypothetical protein